MDALDYGRRLTVDGFGPRSLEPVTAQELIELLTELFGLLEGRRAITVSTSLVTADGVTAAVCGAEGHLTLHLFPTLGKVTVQVLSRREVQLSRLTEWLDKTFSVGRFESHLGNVTKSLPKDETSLKRVVAGDRDYTRVRLDDSLLSA